MPYPMTRTYAGVLPTAAHNEYRLVRGCQCDRRIQPPGKNHARARRTGENPVTRAPARTPTGPQIRRCRRRCRWCRRCSTHLTTRHLRPSRRCCRDSTRHRAGRVGACHAPPPGGCCRTSSPWFCRRVHVDGTEALSPGAPPAAFPRGVWSKTAPLPGSTWKSLCSFSIDPQRNPHSYLTSYIGLTKLYYNK